MESSSKRLWRAVPKVVPRTGPSGLEAVKGEGTLGKREAYS